MSDLQAIGIKDNWYKICQDRQQWYQVCLKGVKAVRQKKCDVNCAANAVGAPVVYTCTCGRSFR